MLLHPSKPPKWAAHFQQAVQPITSNSASSLPSEMVEKVKLDFLPISNNPDSTKVNTLCKTWMRKKATFSEGFQLNTV